MASKRTLFFEELPPLKRPRVAGGLEVLPDGVLGTIVGFFCRSPTKMTSMRSTIAWPRACTTRSPTTTRRCLWRDALALLGSCRLLRYGPLWASAAVFQRMLHGTFVRLCRDRLALDCRCPQYELRSPGDYGGADAPGAGAAPRSRATTRQCCDCLRLENDADLQGRRAKP